MKKFGYVFIILCMVLCLVPFVGMAVRPVAESTENRTLSSFPELRAADGSPNREFFNQFNTYFNEHFAFRNELVYADARIQSDVFGVSAEDDVIAGKEGWLYYESTLNDYLGRELPTEHEVYGMARNLYLTCQYVESRKATGVVTIAPNKNTLYGENMPYYASYIVQPGAHTIDRLRPYFEELGVPYANLVDLLRKERKGELLYLKRDSHWNNKGALLAYNEIMDTLEKKHDSYEDVAVRRANDAYGDLNSMLYTFYGEKELEHHYDIPDYRITNGAESVESPIIKTEGDEGSGRLLMFRDSFANALIPFVAPQFEASLFTKDGAYLVEERIDACKPDFVVFERGERGIINYLRTPPVFTAMEMELPFIDAVSEKETELLVTAAEFDSDYVQIRGQIDESLVRDDTDYLLSVNGSCYEALHTEGTGFVMYFKRNHAPSFPMEITVMTRSGGTVTALPETTVEREGE